jgi:trk system potassium uptake protein TrkA
MQKIIIVGAGEVGLHLANVLSENPKNAISILENDEVQAMIADQESNVVVVRADGSSAKALEHAGINKCDYFLAMTWDDRANLIACSLAKALGAAKTIARVHDQTYVDHSVIDYNLHFGIDALVNPESLCAMEIVQPIRNQLRFVMEIYAQGKIEVELLQIEDGSKLKGLYIHELKMDSSLRIAYVQRGNEIVVATAHTRLFVDDILIFFGEPSALRAYEKKYFRKTFSQNRSIVLCGASEIARCIIRLLERKHYKVRLIESSEQKCKEFAELFPSLTILQGSPTSHRLLEEERIGEADYFIACSVSDEENVMACLQANKLGAKHVQVVLNKSDHEDALFSLAEAMNLQSIVSPRVVTQKRISQYLSKDPVQKLGTVGDMDVQIIEVTINKGCIGQSRMISQVGVPEKCVFVSLLRGEEVLVPKADEKLQVGDKLLCLACGEKMEELIERFYPKPKLTQFFFQKEGSRNARIA